MSATREILTEKIEKIWARIAHLEKMNESSSAREIEQLQRELERSIRTLSEMPAQDLKDPRILRG